MIYDFPKIHYNAISRWLSYTWIDSVLKNQLSIRDLLAECLRDKIVADDFVIGVLFGFPTKEELNGEPTMSEKEREYLGRIIEENLRYHKYMFEQANIQLVTIGL